MKMKNDNLKIWIQEAGRERPDKGFTDRVMAEISPMPTGAISVQPVISPLVFRTIFASIALLFAGVIAIQSSTNAAIPDNGDPQLLSDIIRDWIPQFSLSSFPDALMWSPQITGNGVVLVWSLLAFATMTILFTILSRRQAVRL